LDEFVTGNKKFICVANIKKSPRISKPVIGGREK